MIAYFGPGGPNFTPDQIFVTGLRYHPEFSPALGLIIFRKKSVATNLR